MGRVAVVEPASGGKVVARCTVQVGAAPLLFCGGARWEAMTWPLVKCYCWPLWFWFALECVWASSCWPQTEASDSGRRPVFASRNGGTGPDCDCPVPIQKERV